MHHEPTYEELAQRVRELERELEKHKQVVDEYRETEAILQAAMDHSPAGIAIADAPDGNLRYVNDAGLMIGGKSKEDLVDGVGIAQYVASWELLNLDGTPVEADDIPLARAIRHGETGDRQYIVRRNGSHDRIIWAHAAPIFNEAGKVTSGIVVFPDITEQKRAEEALRASEEEYRAITETAKDSIFCKDRDRRYTFVNPAMEKLLGPAAGLLGRTPEEIFDAESAATIHEIDRIALGGDTADAIRSLQIGSETRTFHTVQVPLHDAGNAVVGIAGIVRDISEMKNAEREKHMLQEQLERSKRMEALGQLAGGVAHDLNNVLSGIVSYPELLLMELDPASPLRDPLLTIRDSGVRAARIVQDLLTLSRRGMIAEEVIDLNAMVRSCLESPEYRMLQAEHGQVSIETRIAADKPYVTGSSIHVSKTIMNLITNAMEAVAWGGRIKIATTNKRVDKPFGEYDSVQEGDYVVIGVSDNGCGIAASDVKRIFEPFYTSKVMGKTSGTGLGMAIVWGTMRDHHGYIDVDSVEDEGTTFELYFPVTREIPGAAQDPAGSDAYFGDGQSILVVDDVDAQRDIASGILGYLNYDVVTVASGEAAVDYLKTHSVDLVLLDMIMEPGMDGLDTYKRILAMHPDQPAIITSGYSETERVKEARRLGAGAYIRKPYAMSTIAKTVKAELCK